MKRTETRWLSIGPFKIEHDPSVDEVIDEYPRPKFRSECLTDGHNEARPCPYLSCRYHMGVQISPAGTLKLVQNWDDGRDTCVLDIVERLEPPPEGYAMTLDDVGAWFGLTRERVRQIETRALEKLRKIKKIAPIKLLEVLGIDSPSEIAFTPSSDSVEDVQELRVFKIE